MPELVSLAEVISSSFSPSTARFIRTESVPFNALLSSPLTAGHSMNMQYSSPDVDFVVGLLRDKRATLAAQLAQVSAGVSSNMDPDNITQLVNVTNELQKVDEQLRVRLRLDLDSKRHLLRLTRCSEV